MLNYSVFFLILSLLVFSDSDKQKMKRKQMADTSNYVHTERYSAFMSGTWSFWIAPAYQWSYLNDSIVVFSVR